MLASDISFIQSQITRIGTALFFCDPDARLNFPAYIITALKTDEAGEIWFFISRGGESPDIQQEHPFGAHLEFYRKGYPFFMRISGKASVEEGEEKIQELMGKSFRVTEQLLKDILLVKVRIESYYHKELSDPGATGWWSIFSGWWKLLRSRFGQWRPDPAPAV